MATGSFGGRKRSSIVGLDSLAVLREAQVVTRSDAIKALAVDSRTVVESTFGFDQQPDSFLRIIDTGAEGDQWTIDIAGTANDPSSPDRDVPAYSKTFTVLLAEVGDEEAFRDRIIQELNADSAFKTTSRLKASKATDRAIVHILSEAFSLSGEFWERPNASDFDVTVTGSASVVIGYDNLISRSKPVSISRDFDSPHRLGLFGITGQVQVTAKDLDDLFIESASEDGLDINFDMQVNGSGTPVEFLIPAQAATDVFIEEMRFFGTGNGIQMPNFLSKNQPLTNGMNIDIKSDNTPTDIGTIKSTDDFKNRWSFGQGAGGFNVIFASGEDSFLAVFTFNNPFLIRVQDTFTIDDFIRITINDNLASGLRSLEFIAKGFEKEP